VGIWIAGQVGWEILKRACTRQKKIDGHLWEESSHSAGGFVYRAYESAHNPQGKMDFGLFQNPLRDGAQAMLCPTRFKRFSKSNG
jgi:hypothetical protein